MDTLTAGGKGEQSYQSYLYSSSCGKFLNTLLYLTLKRSRSLEAFKLVQFVCLCASLLCSPYFLDGTYESS